MNILSNILKYIFLVSIGLNKKLDLISLILAVPVIFEQLQNFRCFSVLKDKLKWLKVKVLQIHNFNF